MIYRPAFVKVWLSSVCWSPSVKPGSEVEIRTYLQVDVVNSHSLHLKSIHRGISAVVATFQNFTHISIDVTVV